jgi:hypothetical protein
MNEIKVTVELCDKDRARLDKIIDLLEARAIQTQAELEAKLDKPTDDIKGMLERAINPEAVEPPKNAQEEAKAQEHPTLDPFPEAPTAPKEQSEAPAKEVSTAELQQLVIALCRANKKSQVLEVVKSYGVQTVAAIPKDKLAEAYAKLKQLEG